MSTQMPDELRAARRRRNPEHAIPCPVPGCGAREHVACTTPKGRTLTGGSHPSRLDAWLVQQHTQPRTA